MRNIHFLPVVRWLLIMTLLASCNAMAEIYRWTDADGNVHYSQSKAPEARDLKVIPEESPQNDPDPQEEINRLTKKLDQLAAERAQREVQKARQQAAQKRRSERCNKARSQLTELNNSGYPTYLRTETGYQLLTLEMRQTRIQRLQQIIQKNCDQD